MRARSSSKTSTRRSVGSSVEKELQRNGRIRVRVRNVMSFAIVGEEERFRESESERGTQEKLNEVVAAECFPEIENYLWYLK